ncbi:helix-turn-helix domain-containing protein [Terasakiella sp.]|uniref:helix-turn-helix domain-containing protein n=1 Tax=Terasakiella sp. TaxID=2034861 RepID=UPI003AA86706
MKLEKYLEDNGLTMQAFANQVDVHVSTIHRLKYQKIMPSRRVAEAIYRETKGQVSITDLVELKGK